MRKIEVKKVTLEKVQKQHIEKAISQIKKGWTVEQIAAKTGMNEELADRICRMYLTHPGVDADGIMTKLGL